MSFRTRKPAMDFLATVVSAFGGIVVRSFLCGFCFLAVTERFKPHSRCFRSFSRRWGLHFVLVTELSSAFRTDLVLVLRLQGCVCLRYQASSRPPWFLQSAFLVASILDPTRHRRPCRWHQPTTGCSASTASLWEYGRLATSGTDGVGADCHR